MLETKSINKQEAFNDFLENITNLQKFHKSKKHQYFVTKEIEKTSLSKAFNLIFNSVEEAIPYKSINIKLNDEYSFNKHYFYNDALCKIAKFSLNSAFHYLFKFNSLSSKSRKDDFFHGLMLIAAIPDNLLNLPALPQTLYSNYLHRVTPNSIFKPEQKSNKVKSIHKYYPYVDDEFYHIQFHNQPFTGFNFDAEYQELIIDFLDIISHKDKNHALSPFLNFNNISSFGINLFDKYVSKNLFDYIFQNSMIFAKTYSKHQDLSFTILPINVFQYQEEFVTSKHISIETAQQNVIDFLNNKHFQSCMNKDLDYLYKNPNSKRAKNSLNILYSTYLRFPYFRTIFKKFIRENHIDFYKTQFQSKQIKSDMSLAKNLICNSPMNKPAEYYQINLVNKPNAIATLFFHNNCGTQNLFLKNNEKITHWLLSLFENNQYKEYKDLYGAPSITSLAFRKILIENKSLINPSLFKKYREGYMNGMINFPIKDLKKISNDYRAKHLHEELLLHKDEQIKRNKKKL